MDQPNLTTHVFSDELWRSIPIQDYLKKSKDPTPAHEYYLQLLRGESTLLTGEPHTHDFVIAKIYNDHDGLTFFIQVAYSEYGGFNKYVEAFKNLAISFRCNHLKWGSYRSGYLRLDKKSRLLKALDKYEIESVNYSIKLDLPELVMQDSCQNKEVLYE